MSDQMPDEVWLDLSNPDIWRALRGRTDHEFSGISPKDSYVQIVRYIRADLYERDEAERDRLRVALERLTRGEGGVNSLEQERIAQEALDHD